MQEGAEGMDLPMETQKADNDAVSSKPAKTSKSFAVNSVFIHAAEDFPDDDEESENEAMNELDSSGADCVDSSATEGTIKRVRWFKKPISSLNFLPVLLKDDVSSQENKETLQLPRNRVKRDSLSVDDATTETPFQPVAQSLTTRIESTTSLPSPSPGHPKILEEMFSKKIKLKGINDRFNIPNSFYVDEIWKDTELESLKAQINQTKSLLDEMNLDQWHMHTKRMNPAGEVSILLRKKIAPEYCSQAWCKMFECLNSYPIIPNSITQAVRQPGLNASVPFCSVHLCEAPGAFISATNHFLRTRYRMIGWKWLATTLNPYFEGNDVGKMINEDQLLMSSRNNWTFLKDSTGNIMDEANIAFLKEEVQKKFTGSDGLPMPVSLVTADGSIDCQSFPAEQESVVAKLQFAEIIAALSILGQGGSFLLKIFTFFENQTISHLHILCSVFREVNLFKPATSKEGNSEVYVVCLGFYGMLEGELEKLKKSLVEYDEHVQGFSLIQRSLITDGQLLDRIVEASKFFTIKQNDVIRRNVEYFKSEPSFRYYVNDIMRQELANDWVSRFKVKKLPQNYKLFGKDKCFTKLKSACHVDQRGECGTFKDKVMRMEATSSKKLNFISKDLAAFTLHFDKEWLTIPLKYQGSIFKLIEGKKFETILSSRFCLSKPLLLRAELRRLFPLSLGIETCAVEVHGIYKHSHGSMLDLRKVLHRLLKIKSCYMKSMYQLHCVCHNSLRDTLVWTDNESFAGIIMNVIGRLDHMEPLDSLFICLYPLLTRLQLGIACALSKLFYSTHICYGSPGHPTGIIFHTLKTKDGFEFEEVSKILLQVACSILSSKDYGIMEVVPLETLIKLEAYNHVFNYNLYNVLYSTKKAVAVAQQIFEEKERKEQKVSKVN